MDMIKKHGNNETQIIYKDFHLFFSYDTPVAAYDESEGVIYTTTKKYSRTTTAHIKKWIAYIDDVYNWGAQKEMSADTFLNLAQDINLGKSFKEIMEPPTTPEEVREKRYFSIIEDS
jgi:hypothetical protein